MRAALVLLTFFFSAACEAAQFYNGTVKGWPAIKISGPIEQTDPALFTQITNGKPFLIVQLSSFGGNAYAGEIIGRMIRERHYATLVANDEGCFSACALIWIGGSRRFMGETSTVGFHAVFNYSGQIVSDGNALVGAYFGQLGLNDRAISWLTQADPKSIAQLTPQMAETLAIEIAPAKQADAIIYSDAPSAINLRPSSGNVSIEPITSDKTPTLLAKLPSPTYSPPQTPSPIGASDAVAVLTDEEVAAAHRLARAFVSRKVSGLAALHDSVDTCYKQSVESLKATSAEYCIGLDALSGMLASQMAQQVNGTVPAYFTAQELENRIAWVGTQMGGDAKSLRKHALQMVKVAYGDIRNNTAYNPAPKHIVQFQSPTCRAEDGDLFFGLCQLFSANVSR